MSDPKQSPPPDAQHVASWFARYMEDLGERSVVRPAQPGVRYACPCCRCLTLDERGGYDICPVCFWEDDGQDDEDADQVRGGPNGALSLARARRNYASFGACEKKMRPHVRPPTAEEKPTDEPG
jgi:hypothetical protein